MATYWWVAPVVLVVGWYVHHRLSVRRDIRKEVRDQIDALISLIEDVQDQCYKYYSCPGNDRDNVVLGQDIRCKVKQIGTRASNINNDLPGSALTSRAIRFRQAATLKLDDIGRPGLAVSDPLFENISTTGSALINALEGGFRSRFK